MTEQQSLLIFSGLVALVNGIILLVLRWIGVNVRGINQQLAKINGRVGTLEQWKGDQGKFCDERHDGNAREHDALRSTLEYLSRQAHLFASKVIP